jgi:hypothetical protein
MAYYDYERTWLAYFENFKSQMLARPLYLGGVSGSGGGGGGPIGGFIGQLPQTKVSYDTDEFALITTPESSSILDNLNHIRYRLSGLENATADTASNTVGKIVRWDAGTSTEVIYSGTNAGLVTAVADLGIMDILYLPPLKFTANITLPDSTTLIGTTTYGASEDGWGGSTEINNSTADPTITLGYWCTLDNLTVFATTDSAVSGAVCIDTVGNDVFIKNTRASAYNYNETGDAVAVTNIYGGGEVMIEGGQFVANAAYIPKAPFDYTPWGYWTSKNEYGEYGIQSPSAKLGMGDNYVEVNANGVLKLYGDAQTSIQYKTNNVSNPPTDAELDTVYGVPSTHPAGFTSLLNDNGGGTDVYLVTTDSVNWYYTTLTKAT